MSTRPAAPAASRAGIRLLVILVAALVGIAIGVGVAWSGAGGALFAHDAAMTPTETPEPPQPSASAPAAVPGTCSIQEQVGAPEALSVHGIVADASTGVVTFEHESNAPTPTASVMKLVTAVTAMTSLGPDTRFPTRVYRGEDPGSVVIVGGGDPTLKSGAASYYRDATASLDELAEHVRKTGGATTVTIDESLFAGPQWQPTWNDSDRTEGVIAPISSLMADAGRLDPTNQYSPRTQTPAADAGNAFAQRLGARLVDGVSVAADAQPLAEVWSPTVRELVQVMLLDSDNVIAEVLARHVAIKEGTGNSFTAISDAQQRVLTRLDFDADSFVGVDGSGLSRDNRASARLMLDLVELIKRDEHGLGELAASLPRNQQSGTLKKRLADIPAGAVVAKTGFTEDVYALAGFMTLADGGQLEFAVFVAVPPGGVHTTLDNRAALDAIISGIYHCGGALHDG